MLRDDSAEILIGPNQYVRVSELNDETRPQALTYACNQIRAALRQNVLPWLDALICLGAGDPGSHAEVALAEMLKETGIAARDAAALATFDRHIKNLRRQKGAPKKKRRPVAKKRR